MRTSGLLLTGLMLASPAAAQTLGPGSGPEIAWWRVTAALLLCLMLGVAGALALRARMGSQGPLPHPMRLFVRSLRLAEPAPRRLRLVESLRVGAGVDVSLIGCDGAEYLIAASPHGVAMTPINTSEAER